jgi:integrase
VRLFGALPVAKFRPLNLLTVQEAMASGSWLNEKERQQKTKENRPIGMARTTVNSHTERIKRLWRWASSPADLLPESYPLHKLLEVRGLTPGDYAARETEEVTPVEVSLVEATIPLLPPVAADLLRVLLLAGCRVGELCRMKGKELDTSGPVWLFRPAKFKGQHRAKGKKKVAPRIIAIGPRCQLILRRYLKDDPEAYMFSPAEQDLQLRAAKRARRKTKVYPSEVGRVKRRPKRKPGAKFNHNTLNWSIRRACKRGKIDRWHCHQLRHSAALLVRREIGVDSARAAMGHKNIDQTEHYAGRDLEQAKEVAKKIG